MQDTKKKQAPDTTDKEGPIEKAFAKNRETQGQVKVDSPSNRKLNVRSIIKATATKENVNTGILEFPAQPLINAKEILSAQIPETEYVFPGLIPKGLTILAGKPNMGKSMFCLNLAASIAYGLEFLGQTPAKQEVLYFALEDSPIRIKQRLSVMLPENLQAEDDNT